ncbi:MAG: phosphate regulon sensor histidine kinase PhoR [Gammaproteobacteria bacterium]|nr:phosphate regulon sensor histidine kinase PhoR [Gammaproteobacteria bacterium]
MNFTIVKELRRLAVLLVLASLAAWLLRSLWPLLVVLAGYTAFNLLQLVRLNRWLLQYPADWEPPESSGAWGDLFNNLYRLLRKENLARDELGQLIRRTENSMSALRDGVVVLDRRQQLETWNQAAAQALGLRMASDRGQALTNLVRHPALGEYLQGGDFSQPLCLPAPTGKERMLEYSITRFGAGEYLILIRDVTRLHRLEQMRKDFVANVSHELKTPLTVFKGYLETLGDSIPAEQTAVHRALQHMGAQSERMELLIRDLLLLSRLENTETRNDPQPVAVAGLIQRLADGLELLTQDKQQRIQLDIPPGLRLLGDEGELSSAFGNLLANAVHYSGQNALIQVLWQVQPDGEGRLVFADSGPGIAAHHLPRLTERFYRPDASRVTATGGTGLGLAIVKHVLLRHNARLDISSTPGKGSHFICCFEAQQIQAGN